MKDILLSFCLPTYNSEKWIGDCLFNILKSRRMDFEIVLFYDKSSDKTLDIIKSFKDIRVRIVYNSERCSYGEMLIRCIMSGKGKYSMFVIDRNLLLMRNIERLMTFLEKNDIGCGMCKPINDQDYQVFDPGYDSLKNFGYRHNHIVGIFYKSEYLFKAAEHIKSIKYYNFSPEYLYAECCMMGKSLNYNMCYMNENFFSSVHNKSKSTKHKFNEWYTVFGNADYMYWSIKHLSKLELTKHEKKEIKKQIYKNTVQDSTSYYKSLLCNYTWCKHYGVDYRYVGPLELIFNRIYCSMIYMIAFL